MAIQTLGTDATNSLDVALLWTPAVAQNNALGVGVSGVNQSIYDDRNPTNPYAQTSGTGGFVREGLLFVPNRGVLQLFPGDYVGVDTTSGQPILVTAYGFSAGPWTFAAGALGTDANNSLNLALVWSGVATAAADVADINQAILDDQNPRHPLAQTSGCGGFVKEGLLFVPNRGTLQLFPGDVVAVDSTSGQVILLTAHGLSVGPWTLT